MSRSSAAYPARSNHRNHPDSRTDRVSQIGRDGPLLSSTPQPFAASRNDEGGPAHAITNRSPRTRSAPDATQRLLFFLLNDVRRGLRTDKDRSGHLRSASPDWRSGCLATACRARVGGGFAIVEQDWGRCDAEHAGDHPGSRPIACVTIDRATSGQGRHRVARVGALRGPNRLPASPVQLRRRPVIQ